MSKYRMKKDLYELVTSEIHGALVRCKGSYMSVKQYETIINDINAVLLPATYLDRQEELSNERKND